MNVQQLIQELQTLHLDANVYVATPLPTEMGDCALTGVSVDPDGHGVWIQWATENAGSGMCVGDIVIATDDGLRFEAGN